MVARIRNMRPVAIGVLLGTLLGIGGCETNPYTGRQQLLMTSVAEEMQMGTQAYAQVKSDPKTDY
jgi:metalloendopeptidase OMA1, mitochondrial